MHVGINIGLLGSLVTGWINYLDSWSNLCEFAYRIISRIPGNCFKNTNVEISKKLKTFHKKKPGRNDKVSEFLSILKPQ
jgi:hypothetical protein